MSIEYLTIAIAQLPETLRGLKLVHLTDFHYDGLLLSEKLLAEAIEACNQVKPDLVVLTGDFVTSNPKPIRKLAQWLSRLQSRSGIYAVLGNHDLHFSRSKAEISAALTNVGIKVLWNQIVYPVGAGLALVGLPDFWSSEFNPAPVMEQLEDTVPRIVLSHNPDSAEPLQQWRVDLQLSGHTHGGQVVIPGVGSVPSWLHASREKIPKFLWPWIPFLEAKWPRVVKHWQWSQGLHQVGSNHLYVNRGLGTFPPGRWHCPPEVTVITLEPGVPFHQKSFTQMQDDTHQKPLLS
nr:MULTISPECIES: metallophosphoesterase [unclassified Coleofasciculus]